MSEKKINPADVIRLAVAAARAAAGDFTGLALEGARHSRKIVTLIITVVIGVLLLFTTFIYATSKQIPGFEILYEIGKRINPSTDEEPDSNIENTDSQPYKEYRQPECSIQEVLPHLPVYPRSRGKGIGFPTPPS